MNYFPPPPPQPLEAGEVLRHRRLGEPLLLSYPEFPHIGMYYNTIMPYICFALASCSSLKVFWRKAGLALYRRGEEEGDCASKPEQNQQQLC